MTFDQAQSPRLGQRTSIESTYVQIFDVDPATPTADLIEAAWPGMLIFRNDRGILQIYNGDAGAWQDIAGGVAGQLTFVGDSMPVGSGYSIGDVWYDSGADYLQHVWDGDSWELVTATDTVAQAGVVTVSEYALALNSNVLANAEAIDDLAQEVSEAEFIAVSANNSADTADGRVSMSDYKPGADDLMYETTQTRIDPDTGEQVEIIVSVPRNYGSIWFTRTRPRSNLCTNPSLETDSVGWAGIQATITRVTGVLVPAGFYTLKVVNSATVGDHTVTYGETTHLPCESGQIFTASCYAELLTGATPPTVTLQIRWYDATDTLISTSVGDPYTLVADAFASAAAGTIAEPRVHVTGTAPDLAVSFGIREVCASGSESYEWHTGAMLIEQEDDLGRYFDGDSFPELPDEASWADVPHASISTLAGDKILEIYELRDGDWHIKRLVSDAISELDAAKLTGVLPSELIGDNTIEPDKMLVDTALTSEALIAGDIVNIYNLVVGGVGTFRVRRATYLNYQRQAHGFVLNSVPSGTMVPIYYQGRVSGLSNLAPGTQWLGISGKVTNQPPSTVGSLVQQIGFAATSSVLNFNPGFAIRIT